MGKSWVYLLVWPRNEYPYQHRQHCYWDHVFYQCYELILPELGLGVGSPLIHSEHASNDRNDINLDNPVSPSVMSSGRAYDAASLNPTWSGEVDSSIRRNYKLTEFGLINCNIRGMISLVVADLILNVNAMRHSGLSTELNTNICLLHQFTDLHQQM